MGTELNQITSSFVSLIQYYQRNIKDVLKNEYAAKSFKLITYKGLDKSSQKEKLQFSSKAIEVLSSRIRLSVANVKVGYESEYVTSALEKVEIDFIQQTMLTKT
jgi:hypothetical protein